MKLNMKGKIPICGDDIDKGKELAQLMNLELSGLIQGEMASMHLENTIMQLTDELMEQNPDYGHAMLTQYLLAHLEKVKPSADTAD